MLLLALPASFGGNTPLCAASAERHRLVVDVAAAPQISPSGLMWAPLAADARATAAVRPAEVHAARGSVAGRRSASPPCMPRTGCRRTSSSRAGAASHRRARLELFEIETSARERRRGHATKLIAGLRETLPLVVDGVPLLWAKDVGRRRPVRGGLRGARRRVPARVGAEPRGRLIREENFMADSGSLSKHKPPFGSESAPSSRSGGSCSRRLSPQAK